MKKAMALTMAAAALAGLYGCTDLKPLEDQFDDLTVQFNELRAQMRATKASADQAMRSAQANTAILNAAQKTANRALGAAQSAQAAVDATNDKIDRMFRRTPPK